MKKLFILLGVIALSAMSANVFAQGGTGVAPQIGSTHDYWVNANVEGTAQTSGIGNNFKWWVSNNTSDLRDAMAEGTDFTVVSGIYSGDGGEDNFTIQLVWNPVSAGKTYYLVVEETDEEGCKNLKAATIQPVNTFDLIFAAVDELDADADNPKRCAPDIALTADGTNITYNYGSDEYVYKISSTGLYSNWTFDYAFTNTLGNATPTIEYSTDGFDYSSVSASGSDVSVEPDANGTATVYFKVSINNGTTAGTFEEGLDEQSMMLILTGISDGVNAPANIYKSNGTNKFEEDEDIKQTQTVKARPATSPIGYN